MPDENSQLSQHISGTRHIQAEEAYEKILVRFLPQDEFEKLETRLESASNGSVRVRELRR